MCFDIMFHLTVGLFLLLQISSLLYNIILFLQYGRHKKENLKNANVLVNKHAIREKASN